MQPVSQAVFNRRRTEEPRANAPERRRVLGGGAEERILRYVRPRRAETSSAGRADEEDPGVGVVAVLGRRPGAADGTRAR